MAKRQSAKTNKGERSNRGNGKAPKKNPKSFARTSLIETVKREERRHARSNLTPQKRNELDHVIKRIDDHEVIVCDHPKGHVHEKV